MLICIEIDGQFELESGGQFELELDGQYHWNLQPIVWYSKKVNIVQFFNMDGENPENGDELKQITQHMMDKYVESCE